MKRECYTLCRTEGQTEQALRVRGRRAAKLDGIISARGRDARERVRDPGRLVSLSLNGTGARYGESDSTSSRSRGTSRSSSSSVHFLNVTIPLNDTYQPAAMACSASRVRPGVAVQDADHAGRLRIRDECARCRPPPPGCERRRAASSPPPSAI